jgi:hypothetical protein
VTTKPNRQGTWLTAVIDDGYSKVCLFCATRHGQDPCLIGRERVLELEACSDCEPTQWQRERVAL